MNYEFTVDSFDYADVILKIKRFDVMKIDNKTSYSRGDRFLLKETFGGEETGRSVKVFVDYVLTREESVGISRGYVVVGFDLFDKSEVK